MSVGVNQGPFGTLCYVALQALTYLAGQCDRQGGVLFHPLAVWAAEAARRCGLGTTPVRSRVGQLPSVLNTLPGGILADEILTPGPEQIRALLVVAGNPLTSIPGEARLRQALRQAECVICLDLFQNTTGREADLILPTTSWLERWDIATTTALFQQTSLLQYTRPIPCRPWQRPFRSYILAAMSLALGRPLFGSRVLTRLWQFLTGTLAWLPCPRRSCGRLVWYAAAPGVSLLHDRNQGAIWDEARVRQGTVYGSGILISPLSPCGWERMPPRSGHRSHSPTAQQLRHRYSRILSIRHDAAQCSPSSAVGVVLATIAGCMKRCMTVLLKAPPGWLPQIWLPSVYLRGARSWYRPQVRLCGCQC